MIKYNLQSSDYKKAVNRMQKHISKMPKDKMVRYINWIKETNSELANKLIDD